jgi:hypothetical protein
LAQSITGIPIEHPVAGDPTALTLTGVPLLPASGVTDAENHNGDVITYDNVVNVAQDPILNGNGLGFGSGQYGPTHYNTLINLWGNSPGSYTLFVGEAGVHYGGTYDAEYVYASDTGSLTITPVPDGGLTIAMLGMGLSGLAFCRPLSGGPRPGAGPRLSR